MSDLQTLDTWEIKKIKSSFLGVGSENLAFQPELGRVG